MVTRLLAVVCLVVSVGTSTALAKPTRVQVALDSEASLTKAGFHRNAGGKSTFVGGALSIDTPSYEEWSQPNGFTQTAGDPPGWAVEARLKLDAPCDKPGTGLWIHDGYHFVQLAVTDHELVVMSAPARIEIGPTDRFRTIRIELTGNALAVSVDRKQVWTGAASGDLATVDLMFGALGDGCARNASTWEYMAYETTPAPPLAWPDRMTWHPGTRGADLLAALRPAIAVPASVSDAETPCVAMIALDAGVRDLLPLGYDALHAKQPARELRALRWFDAKQVAGQIHEWSQPRRLPICDPAPGQRCGPQPQIQQYPTPPITAAILDALGNAAQWAKHPHFAVAATAAIARAYTEAIKAKVPGADAAAKRLAARIAKHGPGCGL